MHRNRLWQATLVCALVLLSSSITAQQSGTTSYFYLNGTSMASPHVAGIVALMAQKYPALVAGQAEEILQNSALRMAAGCATVAEPRTTVEHCWGTDATGHGLATADAALAGTPDGAVRRR